MITEKELQQIKKELDNCNDPLFIYDKDADGLSSFLLFYRYKKAGNGHYHQTKYVDESDLARVEEHRPDKIFVLDLPEMTQDFVDGAKVPIVWIDHHLTENIPKGVKYFNPRTYDKEDGSPTSSICYEVIKQDEWLAVAGTIADWHLTNVTEDFAKKHPDLLDPKIKDPAEALFNSEIGKIGNMFNFILKGKTSEVRKATKCLAEIKDPKEILEQTTEQGKYVYGRYVSVNNDFESLYAQAKKQVTKSKLIYFNYPSQEMSFSSEISNKLIYEYPKKIILIVRNKEHEMICSFRSGSVKVRDLLLKALIGVEGRGGGHPMACGAVIKSKDFDKFLEQFKALL